jgi:hypothetical protein
MTNRNRRRLMQFPPTILPPGHPDRVLVSQVTYATNKMDSSVYHHPEKRNFEFGAVVNLRYLKAWYEQLAIEAPKRCRCCSSLWAIEPALDARRTSAAAQTLQSIAAITAAVPAPLAVSPVLSRQRGPRGGEMKAARGSTFAPSTCAQACAVGGEPLMFSLPSFPFQAHNCTSCGLSIRGTTNLQLCQLCGGVVHGHDQLCQLCGGVVHGHDQCLVVEASLEGLVYRRGQMCRNPQLGRI